MGQACAEARARGGDSGACDLEDPGAQPSGPACRWFRYAPRNGGADLLNRRLGLCVAAGYGGWQLRRGTAGLPGGSFHFVLG
jgi:hypothetical protein